MSALTKFLFRAPYSLPRTGEIVRWWEARRLAYNLAVGSAGIITVGALAGTQFLIGGKVTGPPIGMVLGYALLANLFYSLGPAVDTFVMRRWGRDYTEVGPMLFRYGFVFALGVTLLPVPLAAFRVLLEVIFRLTR